MITAFLNGPKILVMLFIFMQWCAARGAEGPGRREAQGSAADTRATTRRCALVWYIASYIPYGQNMIKKAFSKMTFD